MAERDTRAAVTDRERARNEAVGWLVGAIETKHSGFVLAEAERARASAPHISAILEEWAARLAPCDHPSSTGIDRTPIGDPRKVWRCDSCGALQPPDEYCCRGECCGPGSWCCQRAGEHEHGDGPDRDA